MYLKNSNSTDVRYYITGATGFIGSHFTRELLRQNYRNLICFVRGEPNKTLERVQSAVFSADSSYKTPIADQINWDSLKSYCADITEKKFGLDNNTRREIASRGAVFWHFASSLNFEENKKDIIYKHNVAGVQNAVAFAASLGCEKFIYISTAYTVGQHAGHVPESLHSPKKFNNIYEESKCQAEILVISLCKEYGIKPIILRPSIVVGPKDTYKPGGSDSGLYGVIREIEKLKQPLKNSTESIRVHCDPDAELNLIPVDHVIEDIMDLINDGFGNSNIYHLSANSGVNVRFVLELISKLMGVSKLEFESFDEESASPIEKLIKQKTVFYDGYVQNTKIFCRKIPKKWDLTESDVSKFILQFIKELDKKQVENFFKKRLINTFDNEQLNIYEIGEEYQETVIFVNAVGMPSEFSVPLAKALEKDFRFATWEIRGIPNNCQNTESINVSVSAHIKDFEALLDTLGIDSAHIVGWCSGAHIAARCVSTGRVKSLTLLNGIYGTTEGTQYETSFEKNVKLIMPMVTRSLSDAKRYYEAIYAKNSGIERFVNQETEQTSQILSSTDPGLIHLTSVPFESYHGLFRYGQLIEAIYQDIAENPITELTVPTSVFTGSADVTAHPEDSRLFAERLSIPHFECIENMDHFGIYKDAELIKKVKKMLCSMISIRPNSVAVV